MTSPAKKISKTPTASTSEAREYNPPQTGLVSYLPASCIPFAELMRLDRMAGFWAFYWHYLIGITFAINLPSSNNQDAPPPLIVAFLAAYLYLWTVVFRGIVCSWNDNVDQDFDRKVRRTRFRPIARGAVTTMQGHAFTIALIIVSGLLMIPLPRIVSIHALANGMMLFIYPFLKRVTDFPQVFLGFGMSLPIFMCCAILTRDPLAPLWSNGVSASNWRALSSSTAFLSATCLYVAGALWTVCYDTIYAHQDYDDDLKAGVQGLAVRLGRKGTKPVLGMVAALQVSALVAAGHYAGFGALYFAVSCGGTAVALFGMLYQVQLERSESCAYWFGPGSRAVGISVVLGLLGEYLRKVI